MSFKRLAGFAGVVFVVLLVINGAMLGDQPMAGDSVQEVRDYVAEDEGMHRAALFVGILVLPFAAILFAGIFEKLRESDREHGEGWAVAAVVGAILIGAAAGVGDVLAAMVFFRGGDGLDDSTLRALWDGQAIAYSSTGVAITALTASAAVPTLRHKVWPMWHGLLGAVVAVLGVLATISVISDTNSGSVWGFVAFIGLLVWSLATSMLLVRETSGAPSAASAVP